jgi:hypothetical protein
MTERKRGAIEVIDADGRPGAQRSKADSSLP